MTASPAFTGKTAATASPRLNPTPGDTAAAPQHPAHFLPRPSRGSGVGRQSAGGAPVPQRYPASCRGPGGARPGPVAGLCYHKGSCRQCRVKTCIAEAALMGDHREEAGDEARPRPRWQLRHPPAAPAWGEVGVPHPSCSHTHVSCAHSGLPSVPLPSSSVPFLLSFRGAGGIGGHVDMEVLETAHEGGSSCSTPRVIPEVTGAPSGAHPAKDGCKYARVANVVLRALASNGSVPAAHGTNQRGCVHKGQCIVLKIRE